MTTPTLEQTVERMKTEVISDILTGDVPSDVTSFSDLHDHVDANYYGGAFEESEKMHGPHVAEEAAWQIHKDDAFGSGCERCTTFWNAAQDAIDRWIKSGAMYARWEALWG
jgi:hypothetical protein